jgi:hypothetical protein
MTYRPMGRLGRLLPLLLLLFPVAAVPIVVTSAQGKGPPIAFTIFWVFAFGWNLYWWLFRICVEVGVDGPSLTWRAPFASGHIPLTDIRRVRQQRLSKQMAVIEVEGRRPLLVPIRYGFGQLQNAIAESAPQAVIDQH